MTEKEKLIEEIEDYLDNAQRRKQFTQIINFSDIQDIAECISDFIQSEIKEDRKKTINLLNRETILEANFTCSCNGFLAKAISKLQKHWEEEDEKVQIERFT